MANIENYGVSLAGVSPKRWWVGIEERRTAANSDNLMVGVWRGTMPIAPEALPTTTNIFCMERLIDSVMNHLLE